MRADSQTMAGCPTTQTLIGRALGGEYIVHYCSLPLLTCTVHANLASDVYAVAALLLVPVMRAMAAMASQKKAPPCAHATGAEVEAAMLGADGNPAVNVGLTTGLVLPTMDTRQPEVGTGPKTHLRDTRTLCLPWATTGGPMLSTRRPLCVKDRFCRA